MSGRKETVLLKPFKLATNRDMKSSCEICNSTFQRVVNKQHQCKLCSRVVCEKCVSGKTKVFYADGHSSIDRCCQLCVKEENFISTIIRENRLVFGQDSILCQEWVRKINKEKMSYNDILKEYNDKVFENSPNSIKFRRQSGRVLDELFASYNYSLRQFIGRLTEDLGDQIVNDKITNVMVAVYVYLKDLPFIYELIYIVAFISCFCNEFHSYFIITRFIEKIFPQYLRLQKLKKDNLLSHQLKILIDMYKILIKKGQKEELDIIAMYLETRFTYLMKSLTINTTSASISFYIIDQILKNGSYIYLYKSITSLMFHSRDLLCQWQDPGAIEAHILKTINLEQLKSSMITFQKSSVKFQMEHQFFDSAQHRKLHEKYKQLEGMYQKSEEKSRILDQKHKNLLKDYEQTILKLNQNGKKIITLQQEILSFADKLILVEQNQKYKEENTLLTKRNTFLNQQNGVLKKNFEDLQKKYAVEDTNRRIFMKVKDDYQKELVDLKTKNEIYQIQKMANDINFNTSFIEQRIDGKNKRISELERMNNQYSIQLDFYRNSRPGATMQKADSFFNSSVSIIQSKNNLQDSRKQFSTSNNTLNFTNLHISTKEEKDNFKKYIEMSKEMIDKLKQDLHLSDVRKQQLEKQVIVLRDTIENQKRHLELNEQINNFINQIPEEINYSISVRELQTIISKQTNPRKKVQLQGILNSFKKCLYEVRYRTIDAKLKENKIKEVDGISNINSKSQLESCLHEKPKQRTDQSIVQQNKGMENVLNWMGNESQLAETNRSAIKKDQCSIM